VEEPVRILLPPGTYVLDFRFSELNPQPENPPETGAVNSSPREQEIISSLPVRTASEFSGGEKGALVAFRQHEELKHLRPGAPAVGPLWSPILSAGKEVFICLGHADPLNADDPVIELTSGGLQRITVTDLKAYTNISGFLQMNGQSFQMRMDNQTTLLDLRDRPTVLIGNHNNDWALKLTGNLRYRFDFDEADAGKPNRVVSIVDTQEPHRLWQVSLRDPESPSVDYAIAGRFFNPISGSLIFFVAGARPVGTQAASEFMTRPQFLQGLPDSLKNPKTNLEVVLKTPIIAGVPGSPEVVATHVGTGMKAIEAIARTIA